jgi:hypothetical protein
MESQYSENEKESEKRDLVTKKRKTEPRTFLVALQSTL